MLFIFTRKPFHFPWGRNTFINEQLQEEEISIKIDIKVSKNCVTFVLKKMLFLILSASEAPVVTDGEAEEGGKEGGGW